MTVVSIVIPTAGTHRIPHLIECLRSIERGLLPGEQQEVIVVLDGGDLDDYRELCTLDNPVTVLRQAHAGPAAARNMGWHRAAGDVIAFLDDDTVVAPTWLESVRARFTRAPELAAAGGEVLPLDNRNVVSRMFTDMGHMGHRPGPHGWRLITANAAFRRTALEAVSGFDERFTLAAGEDFDVCDRLGAAGFDIGRMPAAVVYHRNPRRIRALLATCRRYRAGLVTAERVASTAAPEGSGVRPPLPVLVRRWFQVRRERSIRLLDRLGLPRRMVMTIAMTLYVVPYVRRFPHWYDAARDAPSRPSRRMALGEALLEWLWRTQWAAAGVVQSAR